MTSISSSKGAVNDETSNPETGSSNHSQEDEDDPFTFRSRKSYPQRNNRPKLNYRDLERGYYDRDDLRQSMWALGGPTVLNRPPRPSKAERDLVYSDEEDEEMETANVAADDTDELSVEQKDKSADASDQMHRRLWCICKKPWDHSRLMLRCDSCSNWYHGDCIGMTKEQARILDMKGDQFVCPPCQGVSPSSASKVGRSSDESIVIKRKRMDAVSPLDRKTGDKSDNPPSSKVNTQSEPLKRPKTGIFFQRDAPAERQIHCIVQSCSNWAKAGWVYCSSACIRRHINDTLQAIQRSKGTDNENSPSREDILLYESRTKKVLDRTLVPKVEDLCTWINQHPSYEIVKPALRQSILLTANEAKSSAATNFNRPTSITSSNISTTPKTPPPPTSTKPKLSWVPIGPAAKSVPITKAPVLLTKPSTPTTPLSNTPNTADIRSKVPSALYDKLLMRIEKSGESVQSNDEMRTIVEKIEEEMFRVYGKVDNAYKNKFRSLLANISNMSNNFFYKQVLSKEVTAKQIVAMKPEDMLPPEEKEKRKDEFEKEVQKIMKAEEETAEEMARRVRMKVTRQGLVDNEAIRPVFGEKDSAKKTEEKEKSAAIVKPMEKVKSNTNDKSKVVKKSVSSASSTTTKPVIKTKKPKSEPTTNEAPVPEPEVPADVEPAPPESLASPPPSIPVANKPVEIPEPIVEEVPKTSPSTHEDSTSFYPVADPDNDYIEPESPTGIDALIYDDEDELNNSNIRSRSSSIVQASSQQQQPADSPSDTPDYLPPVRDDYNPIAASKVKTDSTSTHQPSSVIHLSSFTAQWRGVIIPPDMKIACQSVRVYGDSDYLLADIPEQLGILGRLRIGDLWDYVRDSLPVRDVIILTLIPSNSNENVNFQRYVEALRTSGRAAVINKRTEPSVIRDMYLSIAETKDCPPTVLSTLSLSTTVDSKQLFLVIIGSGKRSIKINNNNIRGSESPAINNLMYKPVSLQDPSLIRDPRLSRNKDPRLAATTTSELNPDESLTKISVDQALKMIAESLERVRQSSSMDQMSSIIQSTLDYLKTQGHENLSARFMDGIPSATPTWTTGLNRTKSNDDNLNEENMEVDEELEKKQLIESEFNDVDYRFLGQDMDHRRATMKLDQDFDFRTS